MELLNVHLELREKKKIKRQSFPNSDLFICIFLRTARKKSLNVEIKTHNFEKKSKNCEI